MIISRGRRYIFVHAPKTGGTSLQLALEARAMKDDVMLGDTPKAKKRRRRLEGVEASGRLWKHSRLCDLYGVVTQDDIEEFFVFTLVRNPWDRMVSYFHWLQEQRFDHPVVDLAKTRPFEAFVSDPLVLGSVRETPYANYVTDEKGAERGNLFIRLEEMSQDIAPLEAHLGFSLGVVPHVNQSNRAVDYRGYYSDAAAQALAEAAAADISRFNYTFDG